MIKKWFCKFYVINDDRISIKRIRNEQLYSGVAGAVMYANGVTRICSASVKWDTTGDCKSILYQLRCQFNFVALERHVSFTAV